MGSTFNNFKKTGVLTALSLSSITMMLSACSDTSSTSGGSSSGVAVSGTLTQATVSSAGDPATGNMYASAVVGTKVSLDCGSKGVFSATVDATTGAFSVSGVPTGAPCSFNFVSSTSGNVKCQVQFQDSSNYDLNNNAMSTNTATPKGGITMGNITCDSSGNITIPTTDLASSVDAGSTISSSTAFDFSGIWSAAAYDGTLPTGYETIAACTSNCHGPTPGQNITLVRFKGQKFTPSTGLCTPALNVSCPVSSGTVDTTSEGYGMSIWGGNYANGIGACGGNTGFTADEARAYARLSLDSVAPTIDGHALTYAHYAWSTPTGFGTQANWTKDWMWNGATSSWNVMDCQPVSVPSTSGGSNKPGYACFAPTVTSGTPNNLYVWNVGLQNAGGCTDSTGAPLMVNNWANITFGTCTNSASAFNSNFSTSSCSYTGAPVLGGSSTTFTCSWTGGSFKDFSGATTSTSNNGPNFSDPYTMPANTWGGQPGTILASGANCGSGGTSVGGFSEATLITQAGTNNALGKKSAKELLARYQCFANAYWSHVSNGGGSTSCSANYNFDWSTSNYANFVMGDVRSMKPQNAFITDRVFYSPDGQWAFLKNADTKFQSIPTASGSTLCPMKSITELKFGRVTDSKLLVNFTQKTIMADRSTACQAAVTAALAGGGTLSPDPTGLNNLYQQLQTQKMLFYMTK